MTSNAEPGAGQETVPALDGEPGIPDVTQPKPLRVSWNGLLAVALLAMSLIAVTAMSLNRMFSNSKPDDEASRKQAGEQPTAAAAEPRKLDMSLPPVARAPASAPIVPAIVPTADEALPDPIGVRRQPSNSAPVEPQRVAPEDAPVLLVSAGRSKAATALGKQPAEPAEAGDPGSDPLAATRRNLQAYQQQLQGLLDTMGRTMSADTAPPSAGALSSLMPPMAGAAAAPGLFGRQLQGSATPRVTAQTLGNRSLMLPKGTAFTCALKTRVVSATSGLVGCQVQRNVYSDDGRVLLVERGSHLDGEYRITSLKPGTVRIPVLWTRLRTPNGVTVDLESPGTGPLGESGIDGHVDNRWGSRIGAALLLSLIDDSVKLIVPNQSGDTRADTIVLPSTTGSTSKLAEKVLESTINIPPLIYQNQGGIVGVYVARDVDFSGVYALKASAR